MDTWLPLVEQGSLLLSFVTFACILAWTLARWNRPIEQCKFLPLEDENDHARHS